MEHNLHMYTSLEHNLYIIVVIISRCYRIHAPNFLFHIWLENNHEILCKSNNTLEPQSSKKLLSQKLSPLSTHI